MVEIDNKKLYKMLVDDDQMKEINGIKGILDWHKLNIEIVGHATNGKNGVAEALRLEPDIIITDIVMPIMDGIEMMKKIKEFLPNVKFIFISCFNDFKFANIAIKEDVGGYVLKPLLPQELLEAVVKIVGGYEQEKQKSLELLSLREKLKDLWNDNPYR